MKENINLIVLGIGIFATFLLLLGAYKFTILGTDVIIFGHQFFTGSEIKELNPMKVYIVPDYLKAVVILLPAIAGGLNYFKKDSKLATQISIGLFIAAIILIFVMFANFANKEGIDVKKTDKNSLQFTVIGIIGIITTILGAVGVGYKLSEGNLN